MSLTLAIRIFEVLLGWSLLLQTLEYLRVQSLDRVAVWPILQQEIPARPAWIKVCLNKLFQPCPYKALLGLRLALAIALMLGHIGLIGALLLFLIAMLLLLRGWSGLKKAWFPVFFLIFMVPLPGVFTQMLTLPLKMAVSWCAEFIMHAAGYPIGRSGVILVIGPYQLLVADACSGLNSIFTLEALGLFYMKLMDYRSRARNVLLAIMIIPISFVSNVTRVLALILITYYFGDEVGQGFMHNFAGVVLFSVALLLIYGFDRLLAVKFDASSSEPIREVRA